MSSTDIADVNKFFQGYGIHIGSSAGYGAVVGNPVNSVGCRLNYAIASSVVRTRPESDMSIVYWTTLLDVVFYRGLQDRI